MAAVVALKSVTSPSKPKVPGQECPRPDTVYPLTTALEALQFHSFRVVSVKGCVVLEGIVDWHPLRIAQSSR